MRRILGLFAILFAVGSFQPTKAENIFGVSEELFEYWWTGVNNMPDTSTVIVADSLSRLGEKTDNDTVRLMSENLYYILCFYKLDEENFNIHSNRCKTLCKKLNNQHMYATTVKNRIGFYINIGQSEKAMTEANDLLVEGKETGNAEELIYAYVALEELCEANGQYQESIEMSHLALDLIQQYPDIGIDPLEPIKTLAESFQALNQIDSCEYYLQMAEKIDPNFAEAPYLRAENDWALHEDKKYFYEQYNKIMAMGPSRLHSESICRQQMEMMKCAIEGDIEKAKAIGISEGISRRNEITILSQIYLFAKDYRKANECLKLLAIVSDSIQSAEVKEMQSKFRTEMETVYETKEKEAQIIRQTYTLIICGVVLFALAVVLFLMTKSNREMKRKNQALTAKINELLDVKQQQIQQQQTQQAPEIPESESAVTEGNELIMHRQVERVIYEIIKRKLFTDADFKRDTLLDELNINKRTFAHDFEETIGQSFTRYILGLRMDFAAQLIREHPEYSNDAIAQMCGMSSRSSFYRNFSEYFGLSPVAYRDGLASV